MKHLILSLFWLYSFSLAAQSDTTIWQKKLKDFKIKPSVGFQLWSTYTSDMKAYDADKQQYEKVDNRLNTLIRRIRLGVKGQPYTNLQFDVTVALDFVGKDALSATEGAINNGATPRFGLWHAYVQWRLKNQSEAANLVIGHIPPIIGREAISSAFRSPSLEKAWSQNYLRRHLVGTGPGRATGINLGGLSGKKSDNNFHIGYDVGLFNPVFETLGGNSTGIKWSPLLVGRLVAYFGEPELTKYGIGHRFNYFGKRKGLSLALSGATQGATDLFSSNQAAGMDLLFNWGELNIDAEWFLMWREGNNGNSDFSVQSQTGYARLGYNILLKRAYVLEPLIMWTRFLGETTLEAQTNAALVGALSGEDDYINIGFNFYFNPNLKLALHYTLRDGDAGAMGDGFTGNNYFNQAGVGAIQRGDLLGLQLVTIF